MPEIEVEPTAIPHRARPLLPNAGLPIFVSWEQDSMNLSEAVDAVAEDLGISLSKSELDRLQGIFGRLGLDIYAEHDPVDIAQAWRDFMGLEKSLGAPDSLEQIYFIAALRHLILSWNVDWRGAFSARWMRADASVLEMAKRLGSRLYSRGRNLSVRGRNLAEGRMLLAAALRVFEHVDRHRDRLTDAALQRLHGMRGVALLLLARADPVPARLRQAIQDLEISHRLGDSSIQNLSYRREGARRLYDQEEDVALLDRLGELLKEPCPRDDQYWSDLARYHQDRAQRATDFGEGDFTVHFDASVAACDAALSAPTGGLEDKRIFHNLRGYMHFLGSQIGSGFDRDRVLEELNLAISDLRTAATAGLGGACLPMALIRRAGMLKLTDLAAANTDLNEAAASLDLADPEIAQKLELQIRASLLDSQIREALDASETNGLLGTCQALVAIGKEASWHLFSLVKALRFCWSAESGETSPDSALIDTSDHVVGLCFSALQSEPVDEHGAVILGAAAGLSRRLDGAFPSERTLALFRAGVDGQTTPSASFLSQAADAALQAGKARSRAGAAHDAEAFYEDAVTRYEAAFQIAESEGEAVAASFLPVVAHSKAGEAYLRLRAGSLGKTKALKQAMHHFEIARELGNNTAELCGLLGDAYYRRGHHSRDTNDLKRALALKLEAQAAGHASRENYSVAARIYQALFELEGGEGLLGHAVEAAIAAHRASVHWPWPFFQLAELARVPSAARQRALARLPAAVREHWLASRFGEGARSLLLEAAVKAAVVGTEFQRRDLGGRSHVFVLDDPHDLLSTTMVLKPMTARDAEREVGTVNAFKEHLRARGALGRFKLPTPITILPTEGDRVIYAMERARADGLDRRIKGADGRGYHARQDVENALEFLGLFHSWAGGGPRPPQSMARLARKFADLVSSLTADPALTRDLTGRFRRLAEVHVPVAGKKDAHPENWLVAEDGKVMMIDLEASSSQACVIDVAQLLDDYPVFTPDAQGWQQRLALCGKYWRQVFGTTPEAGLIERAYTAAVIYRCAFGLVFCARSAPSRAASSSIRALTLRRNHFDDLLHFLEDNGYSSDVRQVAALLRRTRPLPGRARSSHEEEPHVSLMDVEG